MPATLSWTAPKRVIGARPTRHPGQELSTF